MIVLLQRVSFARIWVQGRCVAEGGFGAFALVGFEQGDAEDAVARMADRIVRYRIFADEADKLNRSLLDVGGDLVVAPNFTLAADTKKGTRASHSSALAPEPARELFARLIEELGRCYREEKVHAGAFGEEMRIELALDGPVSYLLKR